MLRAAAVGLGDLGRLEAAELAKLDDVRVVGGADPDPKARNRFEGELGAPTYDSHEELLATESLDLVVVASPHTLHYEQVRDALERGLHVHVEKPMVTDLDRATTLASLASARDLVLAVGYQRHFDPRFRELRRLVDEGRIGDPHMAVCHLEQTWIRWTKDQWRGDPSLSGGGQLYDSGSHLLDALLWTTRSTPVSVAATVDERGHDVDVNSALAATLDRDGTRITASIAVSGAGQSVPAPGESLRVYGTEGSLTYDGDRIAVNEGAAADGMAYEASPPVPDYERLTREKLVNFVAAVRGEAELAIPPSDALKVTALTEAAYEAARTGRTVRVSGDFGVD
jgi:predicted dehydrogenase